MNWDNPGSNPLSAIGESVVGDIGGTAEVRLVTSNYTVGGETYYIGLLTSNSDPNSVSIDPVTGEPSPVGTDVGFGAPLRRYVQSGIYNADFAAPPPDTSAPISDDNPLPYWRFIPSAASNITVQWVADSTSGSGGVLRWTVAAAAGLGETAYIEQLVPINASRGQNWSYRANGEWGPATFNHTAAVYAQYLRSDGVTPTGVLGANGDEFDISANVTVSAGGGTGGTPPDDAAWLQCRFGVQSVTLNNPITVDMYETWLDDGRPYTLLTDVAFPSSTPPGSIYQENGLVRIKAAGTPTSWNVAVTSNGGIIAGNLYDSEVPVAGVVTAASPIATLPGLVVYGTFGHTADLVRVRDWSFTSNFVTTTANGETSFVSGGTSRVPLTVRGGTSQSANLLVVEQNDGTDLLTVAADGSITQQTTSDPLTATRFAANTFGPAIFLSKSRNATIGSHTIVQSGDALGGVMFRGSDGSAFRNAAFITAEVDGTPGSSDMPGRLIFQTTPDGSATLAERMRIDNAGRVGIGVNPSNTNGGVLQLSGGITFPATAVAASDANTLDDYEEGTWTPAITFATPGNLSVTYSSQVGRYTRIGRFVFIEGFVQTSTFTHTTASGTLTVTGLPFTVVNSVTGVSGCAFRGWTDTLAWIGSRPVQNGTSVDFVASKSASVFYTVTAAIMPTGGTVDIRFQLGYVV